MIKRLFDLLLAAAGVVVLAPLFLAIAIWIKCDSPGPVFFRQERVGRDGRPFRIHKFRTMVIDAAEKGPSITVGRDPRITRAGAVLRKLKLDELPQLLDVIAGSMSLVGPRPELPKYVSLYPEESKRIVLSLRPGITDVASLEFFDESELLARASDPEQLYVTEILPRKLALYRSYAETRSLVVDMKIIAKTIGAVLLR